MQFHQLSPIHKAKKRKRVGRGGKRGAYSGRGMKGQKSRAGRKMAPIVRELIKRYPKLRGYRATKKGIKTIAVVNIEVLEKKFKESDVVTPKILYDLGVIRNINGRVPEVKILGKGKITKSLTIKNCILSKTAEEAIKKAGGKIM